MIQSQGGSGPATKVSLQSGSAFNLFTSTRDR